MKREFGPELLTMWLVTFGVALWAIDDYWASCVAGGLGIDLYGGDGDIVCTGRWLIVAALLATSASWSLLRVMDAGSALGSRARLPSAMLLALSLATVAVLVSAPVWGRWEELWLRHSHEATVDSYADSLASWWVRQVEDVTGEFALEPGFIPIDSPEFVGDCVESFPTWVARSSDERVVAAVWMQPGGYHPASGIRCGNTAVRQLSESDLWAFAGKRFEVGALVTLLHGEDGIMVYTGGPVVAEPLAAEPELLRLAELMPGAHQQFTTLMRCADAVGDVVVPPDVVIPPDGTVPFLQCPPSTEPLPWSWR